MKRKRKQLRRKYKARNKVRRNPKKKAKAPFRCVGCKKVWRDGWPKGGLPLMWDGQGNMGGVCPDCLKRKCSSCKKVHNSYWCCSCKKITDTVGFKGTCDECGKKKKASYETKRRKK